MAEITTWTGTSTFSPGMTPFGFYDNDLEFQADADKVAKFCAYRLGWPLMDVELQDINFYTAFENAITTYGNEVFQYKIRENYISLEGVSTSVSANNMIVNPTLDRIIQISQNYGTEAGVGGYVSKYTGILNVTASIQKYDLNQWAIDEGITGSIEVRKVFYESPPAILKYFDPYAGTGTGIQSLMDAFDFGSYSPGINFMLMPISYDALKIQAIEFNDQIRKSGYSFEIVNNQLRIFPVPKESGNYVFEYYKVDEKKAATLQSGSGLVTNASEVPYINPTYTNINSIGRDWIYRYTLAIAKEMLAYIRGKYQTIPVPGSEATLNQQDLLTDARKEKQDLLEELRELLDQTSRKSQLERKADEADAAARVLQGVPMTIYVG